MYIIRFGIHGFYMYNDWLLRLPHRCWANPSPFFPHRTSFFESCASAPGGGPKARRLLVFAALYPGQPLQKVPESKADLEGGSGLGEGAGGRWEVSATSKTKNDGGPGGVV